METATHPSSSSTDGEDMLADVEEEEVKALMDCEKQLQKNPNLYDTHLRNVNLLRSAGLKERLRRARRQFRERFPLSEKLWLEWLEDEPDVDAQVELLALAVEDYLSVRLWKRRLALLSERSSADGLTHWREAVDAALEVCGVHFAEGHEIWLAVLCHETSVLTDLSSDDAEDQVERIRQLYFTAMTTPLRHVDQIVQSYQKWETDRGSLTTDPPPQVQSEKESTAKVIETRKKFEDGLTVEGTAERLAAYVAYCKMEERHGRLPQVECIYERALADFPVTHTLWLQYGNFVEKKSTSYGKIEKLYARATRNCPWLGPLWERRIRAAWLHERDASEVRQIYQQALQAGLQTEEDYMAVILAWLDFLRCDYWKSRSAKGDAPFEPLQDAFVFATSLMRSYFPKYLDPQHRIVRYWSDSLISVSQDLDQARAVWEAYLERPDAAAVYESWTYYIRMEVAEKHHGPARKLYSRAFHSVTDPAAKYTLVTEWLRHEGTTGTAKQYASALHATQSFVQTYLAEAAAQQNPELAAASKRKADKTAKLTEADVTGLRRQRGKPPKSAPPKDFYDDKNTLFVTRIALGTKDEELRAVFEGCGEILALRHLRYYGGETRGRAYVVFADEAGMLAGLEKNETVVNGKPLLVQISDPTRPWRGATHPRAPRGRGRGRGRLPPTEGPKTNEEFRKMLL